MLNWCVFSLGANKKKYTEIEGVQFIRRFLCHIVPYRFVRIRHYGFLSTRVKTKSLHRIRKTLKAKTPHKRKKLSICDVVLLIYGKDINLCPSCKKGILLAHGHWSKNKEPPARLSIVA
jgi:hypothetical protein